MNNLILLVVNLKYPTLNNECNNFLNFSDMFNNSKDSQTITPTEKKNETNI